MHELGAFAARALGEVVALDQGDAQAARGRVKGDAAAGCPAADHEQVEKFAVLQTAEVFLSVHGSRLGFKG